MPTLDGAICEADWFGYNRGMRAHCGIIRGVLRPLLWVTRRWGLLFLLVLAALALRYEGPPLGRLETQVGRELVSRRFNFPAWETRAFLVKVMHGLVAPQRYMTETARRDFVVNYLHLVSEIGQLESEIRRAYTDPAVEEPDAATILLRTRLAELRATQQDRQPLAEAILEEQVSSVLSQAGFGQLGQHIPPVASHFTPLPLLLVVSPRDRIENVYSRSLEHGLDAAEMESVEERVESVADVSSLVTPIGGMAAYPAMLLETSSIDFVTTVAAHEWTHHYLTFRPLGWNYDASGDARTINETVASIVGKEIGLAVLVRYYPEFAPAVPAPDDAGVPAEPAPPSEPPVFDFRAEMRQTRVQVDALLAQGQIKQAEAYMEERRKVFVANGYAIRKLNQAYFAFHGAYADEPGAAGEDRIGPMVNALRAASPNLHTFVSQIAGITTRTELEALLAEGQADT
ncbi:MAG: hypothetical protein GX601_11730 [Anaerolineales bacterium]|nr:hypothetical protein [Anaerolineales bacterium]